MWLWFFLFDPSIVLDDEIVSTRALATNKKTTAGLPSAISWLRLGSFPAKKANHFL